MMMKSLYLSSSEIIIGKGDNLGEVRLRVRVRLRVKLPERRGTRNSDAHFCSANGNQGRVTED